MSEKERKFLNKAHDKKLTNSCLNVAKQTPKLHSILDLTLLYLCRFKHFLAFFVGVKKRHETPQFNPNDF